jgi:hypothetical protein
MLLAERAPPGDRSVQQWWSTFRRRHQAGAQRCHRARRAAALPELERPASISTLVSHVPDLDDAHWEQVAELMPRVRRYEDQPPLEPRTILAGILWVARTGQSWKELPACFGPWETIHAYYHRWKQKGAWQSIRAALRAPLEAVPP